METVLWGTKKGDPEWMEQLITSTSDPDRLKKAKQWATQNGFVNLRTSTFDGSAPNFAKTITKS